MNGESYPVSVDGVLTAAESARVRADARGLTLGLAVFDTLLVEGGAPVLLARHARRLAESARALGLDDRTPEDLAARVREYLDAVRPAACALRTTIVASTAGSPPGTVIAARALLPPPAGGVELVIEDRFALAGDALDRHKTTNRARHTLATETARARGAWDALLRHADGDFVCAANANLWAVVDGELRTPPLARGALPGIVRAVLTSDRELALREAPLAPADLHRASEVFLTNSLVRVLPVLAIEGCSQNFPGRTGAHARRATERLAFHERGGNSPGSGTKPA